MDNIILELAPETIKHEIIPVFLEHLKNYGALFQGVGNQETAFKRYSPDYKGYYCVRRLSREIQIYDLDDEISGTLEAADLYVSHGGHSWGAKDLRIIPRGEDEVVLQYLMVDSWSDNVELACAMETWVKNADGNWYLLRQMVEQLGR